jgi:predicted ATP-dependent serine protease
MFDCFYCGAHEQEAPGTCTGCKRELQGSIEEMTVKELRKRLDAVGYNLNLEAVSREPKYYLAI